MRELLRVDEVTRHFPLPSMWGAAKRPVLRALDGVSLSLAAGETLGVVGESGSGKSTLARLALGFDRPTSGTIHLDGKDLSKLTPKQWRAMRRRAQYVFQDTSGSLNPRLTVGEQIREGLDVHAVGSRPERDRLVRQALESVDLDGEFAERYPHQLSGGQQQRVVIARAIILRPALLVADEPVSALDLTVQAQVVALLASLQRATGTAMLFISHDLKVVRRTTARLIVLYLGRIVEEGSTASIFADARHPYTMALLAAMLPSRPAPSPARRFRLAEDAPSLRAQLSGCPLQSRCPFTLDICRMERPPHVPVGTDHKVACHRAAETPRLVKELSQQGLANV